LTESIFTDAKNPGASSEKSGSISQLQNQFADVIFLQGNIGENNPF
jgi:hypothetical protein